MVKTYFSLTPVCFRPTTARLGRDETQSRTSTTGGRNFSQQLALQPLGFFGELEGQGTRQRSRQRNPTKDRRHELDLLGPEPRHGEQNRHRCHFGTAADWFAATEFSTGSGTTEDLVSKYDRVLQVGRNQVCCIQQKHYC